MKTETTHTPGPWAITGADEDCDIVVAPHSRGIGQDIAKVYIPEEGGNQEANARLIAAAPELLAVAVASLAVARNLRQSIEKCEQGRQLAQDYNAAIRKMAEDFTRQAEAAILRAEGGK